MMTRKNYKAIAAVLASVQAETGDPPGWEFDLIVARLADTFKAENPNFQRERFAAAARVNDSEKDW
tara:strand:+ start:173 stop:370 length:198 start_codon:yes stop_codon:yes gene_type:complete